MPTADHVCSPHFGHARDIDGDARGGPDAPEARLAPTVTLSSNATSV